MKINLKVLVALVLIVAVGYWAANSLLPRSYSGSALDFGVGSGTVTVTNPSTGPIPAQFITGSGSFRVASTVEGLSGNSTRQGSGSNATYVFDLELPPGESEFTVTRGRSVNFVADTEANLEATVQPVSASTARTTLIVTAVVVLGALFYIVRITKHRWINLLRRRETPVPDLTQAS